MFIRCQSSCFGFDFEIGLHVVEQLADVDFVGDELDAAWRCGSGSRPSRRGRPAASSRLRTGPSCRRSGRAAAGNCFARRRRCARSPCASTRPRADIGGGPERSRPGCGSPADAAVRRRSRGAILDDLLIELDEVVLVRQLEPLDAGGQPGDRFVFAERVERPGVAVGLSSSHRPLARRAGCDTRPSSARRTGECRNCGADHPFFVSPRRVPLDHRFEQPAPALAVVFGGVPALGDVVEDRVAICVDRRTLRLAAV